MDKKTKHRLFGTLVALGLVVILLPLLQESKELSSQAALIKSPPFPDQATEVTTANPPVINSPINKQDTSPALSAMPAENKVTNTAEKTETINHDVEKSKNVADSQTTSSALANTPVIQEAEPTPIKTTEVPVEKTLVANPMQSTNLIQDSLHENEATHHEKPAPLFKKIHKPLHAKKHNLTKKIESTALKKQPLIQPNELDQDGLMHLKSSGWIIQVGHFKTKVNAIRFANHLRTKGFPAFLQSMSKDEITVFVGPQYKKSAINQLSHELKKELHLEGMILSYNPLAI